MENKNNLPTSLLCVDENVAVDVVRKALNPVSRADVRKTAEEMLAMGSFPQEPQFASKEERDMYLRVRKSVRKAQKSNSASDILQNSR